MDLLLGHALAIDIAAVGTLQVEQKVAVVLINDLGVIPGQRLSRNHDHVALVSSDRDFGLLIIHIDIKRLIILIMIYDTSHKSLFKPKASP